MEMKMADGDWAMDERGMPIRLFGREAALQRIRNRLEIPRGSFLLDPFLGSRLHEIRKGCAGNPEQQALQFAQEALAPMAGVEVLRAVIAGEPPEAVCFELNVYGEREEVVITL